MPEPLHVFWSDEAEDDVVAHLDEHGVTTDEAESVLRACFEQRQPSRAETGRWVVRGYTPDKRFLIVVFDYYPDEHLVVPVTAYEPGA